MKTALIIIFKKIQYLSYMAVFLTVLNFTYVNKMIILHVFQRGSLKL